MSWRFDSIKGRVVTILLIFLSFSHVMGLWLYVQKSEEPITLLHDALLAEQIALLVRLADRIPRTERAAMFDIASGPLLRVSETSSPALQQSVPEDSRAHTFEHLLGVFLNRATHEGIRLVYVPGGRIAVLDNLLGTVRTSAHGEHHLSTRPLAEIRPLGIVSAEVALADGSWAVFAAPLLTVSPFSPLKLGVPLTAMLASVFLIAALVVHRWTQPLSQFAAAAERLGTDIHAPALAERGPSEVRAAARALNLMQERIRRSIEDRTAFATAIAHDLGTPVTRLLLRAHEIEDESARSRILVDLEQMRRMITATLEFAQLDFAAEPSQATDITSLLQSLCHDLSDAGQPVALEAPPNVTLPSKPISLRRAVANLLDNAIKYGRCARVHLATSAQDVRILIEDDGPGIPPNLSETAFQPFRRLAGGDVGVEGTGLGLSIARNIVHGLGGDIFLANRPNAGLQVTILLPRALRPFDVASVGNASAYDLHNNMQTEAKGHL